MPATEVKREIRYQEELDLNFPKEVSAMPGGEAINRCIQCGACTATCPVSLYMDLGPRRIIAMTRGGFKDDVLRSNTIWLCASCYACSVECPKQIKITDVMYSLKRTAIEAKVHPKHFPTPVLSEEFFKSVEKTGRSNEGKTVTKMILRTNPLKLFKQIPLGIKLLLRGRMKLGTERMTGDKQQFDRVLHAVEAGGNGATSHGKEPRS